MKTKLLLALILTGIFNACTSNKSEEKKQLDELLKVHDEVMGISEKAIKNKSTLDSLIHYGKDTSEAVILNKQLTTADEAMENWMHQFNPDYTGKSHTQVMEYLHSQHLQLLHIDSQLNTAIRQSNKYLLKVK